ncbi:4-alpha-glucanotransferase [Pseudonocardia acaciae]|uniref:4-alpha-glucanotransferase n=1 Tax=Pseudonocardia acaciae TaxID=551276 RepID=UPI000688DD2A|nr:4-alpha-glucanotransferase [Pseudonocardia acaciae]
MDEALRRLAAAHGVATEYLDDRRRPVSVDPDVVVRVLGLLGVDSATAADRRRELAAVAERAAAPATVAVRTGEPPRPLPGARQLVAEDGTRRDVRDELPADLAPGWYRASGAGDDVTVIVAPPRAPEAPRAWGWQLQLYALRSDRSWGIGDLGDLREFVSWTAREHGAGAVLLNPLHAPGPTHPVQPSPYTPSSRRFANPLALRIEDVDAYHQADAATRAEVDALRVAPPGARIDHDLVWAAKRSALELLWRATGRPSPEDPPDFAVYNALAERHGARWTDWPPEYRDPSSARAAAGDLAPRVAFHAWVQEQCARQLASVRETAAGMPVGILHDLAVGVDPEGADAWALADVLATNVTVGAPPDDFTPRGQNWGLPPWRPDRLAATGYAAYRDMLRAVLTHADGLRVDHVAGLWRLWWVPPGEEPNRGTYVRYDADAMLAALTLEAHRAGAVIVGEDLGTVEPEVTTALAERGMLGCAVAWFARDDHDDKLLPPAAWPERAAASLSTHDLPTVAGFLRADHVRTRAHLGILTDPDSAHAHAAHERTEWVQHLRESGDLSGRVADSVSPEPSEWDITLAMHRMLASTPCRLRLISPYDVLGEPRQPNLPGTVDEYPNWRLPLPSTLDELRADPRVSEVTAAFRDAAGDREATGDEPEPTDV